MSRFLKDKDWIRQSMILPAHAIDEVDSRRRTYTQAMFGYQDTTLGGNQAINPLPQYTEYADLNAERLFPTISRGMGRKYEEMHNSNAILVHMRFGVPAFNSLTSFFTNFYNSDASRLARTGRTGGVGFFIGRVIGFAASIYFLPLILVGQAIRFLAQKPSTRYYYLKPAMPLYWNALNTMTNMYSANAGFVSALNPQDYGTELASGLSPGDTAERNRLLPDIYRTDGTVDVYKVATRFQRISNARLEKLQEIRENASSLQEAQSRYRDFLSQPIFEPQGRPIKEYLNAYFGAKSATPLPEETRTITPDNAPTEAGAEGSQASGGSGTTFLSQVAESYESLFKTEGGEDASWGDMMKAELRDGAQFITFRVDDTGPVGESFSNQVRDSDLKSFIDGMSNGARSARFSFANGNVSDGLLGQAVGAITQFVGNIVSGAAHQLGVSGLASLAGNALVDIPKHWDGSTANLPRMQYTIQLRTPYGNEMSRFQNLIYPLFCLLAGALPLSTGAQSYTSPFLCELYCQGRAQTRLGMIDTLDIQRGVGDVGFTQEGKALAIDITFSVVDLSSVMHMPITSQFNPIDYLLPGGLSKMFGSDDSSFGDYMAILSGLGLTDQIYPLRKLKRNWYRNQLEFNSWFSASHMTNWIGGWSSVRMLSGLYNATDRGNPTASL